MLGQRAAATRGRTAPSAMARARVCQSLLAVTGNPQPGRVALSVVRNPPLCDNRCK